MARRLIRSTQRAVVATYAKPAEGQRSQGRKPPQAVGRKAQP
jgi:hypothetical protein